MHHTSLARRAAALLALAGVLATACSSGSSGSSGSSAEPEAGGDGTGSTATAASGSPAAIYPGAAWDRVDPAEAGFDQARLDEIAAEAEANGSNCLVVVRDGRIAAEWYWNGTDASTAQEVFSATKSYASTLVGIAQEDGDLDIGDPASDYISEWAGTPSEGVTVEDVLSNDSGRHWDAATDYGGLVRARDRTGFAIGLPQDADPGTTWAYNNSAIQTLDAVVAEATGQEPADFAQQRLLGPLGMDDSEMTRDGAGNTNMFFGLHSTCEDMARFGHLFLRGGEWDGDQIVPRDWVEAATGQPSQELNAGYGYLWWLNHRGPLASPLQPTTGQAGGDVPDGQLAPDAPEDMYWALGLGGQVIQVDPGSDTVVVRLGEGNVGATYGPANTARVVTEALTEP